MALDGPTRPSPALLPFADGGGEPYFPVIRRTRDVALVTASATPPPAIAATQTRIQAAHPLRGTQQVCLDS